MDREELRDWLRLSSAQGIGPSSAHRILATLGLPSEVFRQDHRALTQVLGADLADALLAPQPSLPELLDRTWQWLESGMGTCRIMSLGDPLYPPALLEIPDPPLLLYGMGPVDSWHPALWRRHALAIVGSRNPTPQGSRNAHQFALELASQDVVVVSGLALGIDGAAHEGALCAARPGVNTIAVVGTGLDRVYPARHRDLARRIAQRGILLSEYPLGTPPLPHHFPQRNRILCGLAEGTLVVEAALQSGSLITARLSAEQGKEVFAIPGPIHSPLSKGCHALIRQGAKLVETTQDIFEEFRHWSAVPAPPAVAQKADCGVDRSDCPVLAALGHEPSNLDQLQARTGWPIPDLQVRLMELELLALVARLPGGSFERIHRA
ncbi:DNA-processing protein DprA [Curvibacter sp. APW13]|uniref:DNA-processing protein DprA n=1 Tax=Curvibacter sp. APW13 TaxID=3077236 RepID=UPI0028E06CC4|nr:DNA-processing protein DprA [Curvibacter sp. APW13]MDT8990115.1 DNA-processing protein DprA [Curvibacter sp. APW13]